MKKHFLTIVTVVAVSLLMAFTPASPEQNVPHSLADQLHMSRSKDPVDGGWLPDLTGLPSKEMVDLFTQQILDVMAKQNDHRCNSIDPRLRMLVFQHFLIHQAMANEQRVYFTPKMAQTWAHILAMILKESSGDSTNITDMSGHSMSTYQSQTNLDHWKKILSLSLKNGIKLNYQTNFGLTQTSADRLFNAFHVAQDSNFNTDFLEGKMGTASPKKTILNTAVAIRRIIWFYQDFSQGRLTQTDMRIHQPDIYKPEYIDRYKKGLKTALLFCGTRLMFEHRQKDLWDKNTTSRLEEAMASIAYCKLGNAQHGYGKNEMDEKCFAAWVTLCPALNVDIAILTPLSYFQTRGEEPICENTFAHLLNPKPKSILIHFLQSVVTDMDQWSDDIFHD